MQTLEFHRRGGKLVMLENRSISLVIISVIIRLFACSLDLDPQEAARQFSFKLRNWPERRSTLVPEESFRSAFADTYPKLLNNRLSKSVSEFVLP